MNNLLIEKQIQLDQMQYNLLKLLNKLQKQINTYNLSTLKSMLNRMINKAPTGIYIYGSIGCGKSLLMKNFFQEIITTKKLLIHFHEFMQQTHEQIFCIRKTQRIQYPIKEVAEQLALNYQLICLDELEINDITDAMIVGKLLQELLKRNITIVITSNKHPDELYQHGLQRDRFLEFVDLIKNKMNLFFLNDGIDYRRNKINAKQQVFFTQNHAANNKEIESLFQNLCDNHAPHEYIIHLKKRKLICKNIYKNIAKFTFSEICQENLGPADYIALCKHFRIIIIIDVPALSTENNNEVARFINLVDEIYEHSILLILSSAAELSQVHASGNMAFRFKRTLSRLIEMQSEEYINKAKNLACTIQKQLT